MASTSSSHPKENTVEGNVTIQRPVEEVFAFYEHFDNLPRFLGDVMAVVQIAPATFRWTIQGPFGFRAMTVIKITEMRRNKLIRYETTGVAGLNGSWEIHFGPGPNVHETEVREVMRIPLGRLGRAALGLIGKSPLDEVSSNLHRLKEIIETGRASDTSYSVAAKFD